MKSRSQGLGSNLLRALRPADLALLSPSLESVQLASRQILYQPGDDVNHVYFPCDATLLSFVVPLESGKDVEAALIGREGAVGGIVSHGRLPAYARAIVQCEGPALRMKCVELEQAKAQSLTLRQLFARYADCLMAQMFQSVACNAAHSIEQRTAKWLLATMDRTDDSAIALTQEQLSGLLGVGRSYVGRVMRSLKERRIVEFGYRRLIILDEQALRDTACDCNGLVSRHFHEVLRGVYPSAQDERNAEDPVLDI
ncbi:MAG: Crp/Fnr family transcriptional regulator [Methylocystis sp.]|uniref:Crp/Fnr family transcriptional regulator n=1 Tax=Methylocystis sp. TaxID=1911079 RepID=UPI003D1475C0